MATTRISRDSLDSERRGRIIGEDQHKAAIRVFFGAELGL
jgi:hypothetical protein